MASTSSWLHNGILLAFLISLVISDLPVKIPQVPSEPGQCTNDANIKEEAKKVIREEAVYQLNERYGPPCTCIGDTEIWNKTTIPEWTSCSYTGTVPCHSLKFQVEDKNKVCGMVLATMKNNTSTTSTYAFQNYLLNDQNSINKPYLDGVSITFGTNASMMNHVWSYVVPQHLENEVNFIPYQNCECSNTEIRWPYQPPSFIDNNYFCDYSNNSGDLWTGENCSPSSSCCEVRQGPWFCTSLPSSGDTLEIRSFGDTMNVSQIEIYFA